VRNVARSNPAALPDVRSEVIARYISSSPGIHRPTDLAEREAFISAYQWHLKGWLPADRSLRWLDLGCGQGQLMSLALKNGFQEVFGVDLSAEMLSACEALGLNVRREDATKSVRQLHSGAYGVVSAFDFLEHLPQSEALALLREGRRLLGPTGIMLIKVPNGASPAVGDMFCSDLTHETLFTPSSIAQLATLAGFSRCDVREVGPAPHGIRSFVRYVLWKAVRAWYRLLNAIETGAPGADVVTRVMLVRLAV
jgi:2-polyprenyl-3-methyl-5-hydroxy-6-metoxy-1,4-benzoquinol methylase